MKMKGLITKKSNLDVAKEIIGKYISIADCGLFDSRNLVGDPMITVYSANGLTIDVCHRYSYFEVFGLSDEEFKQLGEYYSQKIKELEAKENDNNG